MQTRPAEDRDLPALLALYAQLNPDIPSSPEPWPAMRARDGLTVYLAEHAGAVVATCTLIVIPNMTNRGRPYALIENVVTDAAHRQRGFGHAVLHAAIEAAWRQGCYKVMLLTGSKRPATLRFYESAGFSQSKTGFQIRRD